MSLGCFSHQPWRRGRATYLTSGRTRAWNWIRPNTENHYCNKGATANMRFQMWAVHSRLLFLLLQRGGVMQQRGWHHRYLRMLPTPAHFFYLVTCSPRLHSSPPSVHRRRFPPHHPLFSSPVKWSLRPVWSPDQLPPPSPPSAARVPWLSARLSLSPLCLRRCHLPCLFLLFWPFCSPHPILLPFIRAQLHFLRCCLSSALTFCCSLNPPALPPLILLILCISIWFSQSHSLNLWISHQKWQKFRFSTTVATAITCSDPVI